MQNIQTKKVTTSEGDKELVECVIKASCVFYNVTSDELMHNSSMARVRQLCYFIIVRSTNLKDYMIGNFFGKKRTAIKYGIEITDHHKEIYRQTLDEINNIIALANNFEKKYIWHIHSINTMYSQKQ